MPLSAPKSLCAINTLMGDNIEQLKHFLASHTEIDDENGCHNWTHYINNCGYALVVNRFYKEHGRATGHQLSWIAHKGEIPAGMCVLHKCDNRRCINPEHLWVGTQAENMRDMIEKGRDVRRKGSDAAGAKLTDAQVRLIRLARLAGITTKVLGDAFAITPGHVSAVALRRKWRHVE